MVPFLPVEAALTTVAKAKERLIPNTIKTKKSFFISSSNKSYSIITYGLPTIRNVYLLVNIYNMIIII